MKPNLKVYWGAGIILGWLLDALFWNKTPGLNFPLFVLACVGAGYLLIRMSGHKPGWKALVLLPVILFFSWGVFVRHEPLTVFLDFTFTLFFMSLLAVTVSEGKWLNYGFVDYIVNLVRFWLRLWVEPLLTRMDSRSNPAESGKADRQMLWQVVRGILLALPIVAVFAGLLASADVVFNQRLESVLQLFKIENWSEYLFRLFYILLAAYALCGVYLYSVVCSRDEKLQGEDQPFVPRLLGITEAGIVLGSVVALFAFFVAIQFRYFFGGQANIHVSGFTYAEYARRGFGELVLVAFGSYLLLMVLAAVTRRNKPGERWVYHILNAGLVVLVFIILLSAYRRLVLYETAYGFSRLRTYTHVALVWIGILLLSILLLEFFQRQRMFALASIAACAGFIVTLNLLNVDAFIVQRNVSREVSRQSNPDKVLVELDEQYFLQLSVDAIPRMAEAVQNPLLNRQAVEKISAMLVCYRQQLESEEETAWQSYHWGRSRAEQALLSVSSLLKGYSYSTGSSGEMVKAPGGEVFECGRQWVD